MNDYLRLLERSDSALMADYFRRNEDFHREWSPITPPDFFTPDFQQTRISASLERRTRGEEYRFGIFLQIDSGEKMVGSITLTAVERGPFQNGRFGYSIDGEYKNAGMMTRNLRRAMTFAFAELGLHRLEANIMPRNHASRRVLEKCGFSKIGFSPRYLLIQNVWEDHEHYIILAETFSAE